MMSDWIGLAIGGALFAGVVGYVAYIFRNRRRYRWLSAGELAGVDAGATDALPLATGPGMK
ncbi:MAG: hypothetical protein ACM31L_19850 [Actinomycetota bacterium]